MPFLSDASFVCRVLISISFTVMFLVCQISYNKAPKMDIVPAQNRIRIILPARRTETVTTGMSVRTGAIAIAIPAFLFCLSVSETTKVNSGPGEMPAANPKTAPKGETILIQSFSY